MALLSNGGNVSYGQPLLVNAPIRRADPPSGGRSFGVEIQLPQLYRGRNRLLTLITWCLRTRRLNHFVYPAEEILAPRESPSPEPQAKQLRLLGILGGLKNPNGKALSNL